MSDESQIAAVDEPVDFEFTTEPKEQPAGAVKGGGLTISLDGYRMVARRPKDAIFAMLASARTSTQKLKMLFDLLRASLSEADWSHIEDRINDRDDSLDLDWVADIAAKLAERWADDTKAATKTKARARR